MLTSSNSNPSGNASSGHSPNDGLDDNPFGHGMSIADLAKQIADQANEETADEPAIQKSDASEPKISQPQNDAPSTYDPSAYDPSTYGLTATSDAVAYDETAIAAAYAAAFDAEISEVQEIVQPQSTPHSQAIPAFSSTFPPEPPPHASERLLPYLNPDTVVQWDPAEIAIAPLPVYSQGMLANAYFFGNPRWNKKYLEEEHRGSAFCDRWHHALRRLNDDPFDMSSGWDNKVVVDLGCGPGNLFQTLGGTPATLIGVDISYGALRRAQQLGYTALLADAHHLPLQSGIADVVVANALLHHCDDMARVLAEAARLVKPGGYLITDLDPQRSAWDRRGWGLWIQQIKLPNLPGLGDSVEEQAWRIATEVHNRQPGVGIEASLYSQILTPWGFDVQLYPHNHHVGAEVFLGEKGRSPLKTRLSQRLSGLDPAGAEAAQSIMCVARRTA